MEKKGELLGELQKSGNRWDLLRKDDGHRGKNRRQGSVAGCTSATVRGWAGTWSKFGVRGLSSSWGGGTLMDYQNSEFGSQLFRPEAQVY